MDEDLTSSVTDYNPCGHTTNALKNSLPTLYIYLGRIQDFKLGGAHLKKLRQAEEGAKIVGVFRVKNPPWIRPCIPKPD
jgi:hypothetical protein